jgi:hypothetical protein
MSSPYGRVFALARSLARGTHTPYAFVQAVRRYLRHNYRYSLTLPVAPRYPLVSFLFGDRAGYCQQFAGAMALLLRMGGVPARVAVGFTSGSHAPHSDQYVVTDRDAHAWVEAWFPGYGWIKFEPTPPTRSQDRLKAPAAGAGAGALSRQGLAHRRAARGHPGGRGGVTPRGGGGRRSGLLTGALVAGAALLLAGMLAVVWALARARAVRRGPHGLLGELERAFRLCGRPIAGGVTLEQLERNLHPAAAGYVRAIRLSRYAPDAADPSAAQRRALRRDLRSGRGIVGGVRALIALPPLPRRPPIPEASGLVS